MPQRNVYGGPEIAAGESESDVLDVGTDVVVGLVVPNEWSSASVSVLVSPDGISFLDLYDGKGNEVTFNAEPGAAISVDPDRFLMARCLKFRSGTRGAPVVQKQRCKFRVVGVAQASDAGGDGTGNDTLPVKAPRK